MEVEASSSVSDVTVPASGVPTPAESVPEFGGRQSTEDSLLSTKVHDFRMSCLDLLYSNLCHNLIPHSGKVVVFDSNLCVKHAFEGMLAHDINSAPVWDSTKRKYVGMLSVSDFIDILLALYYMRQTPHHRSPHQYGLSNSQSLHTLPPVNALQSTQQSTIASNTSPAYTGVNGSDPSAHHSQTSLHTSQSMHAVSEQAKSRQQPVALNEIPNQRICDWAALKRDRGTSINRLLCVTPEATLHDAVRMLLQYRVHRLCVVQLALADTVLRILTNHGILRFLRNNCPSLQSSGVTVRDLGIGVFKQLLTVTYDTKLITALELLYNYKISSIPIVNDKGIPVDVYSRGDVRYLAMDQTYNLDITLGEALKSHKSGRVLPICSRDDTLYTVSGLLVSSMKHSLLCVRPDGSIEGVVSLTDIFSFILDSSAPRAESRIAALKADLQQSLELSPEQAAPPDDDDFNNILQHKPKLDEIGGFIETTQNLDSVIEHYPSDEDDAMEQ